VSAPAALGESGQGQLLGRQGYIEALLAGVGGHGDGTIRFFAVMPAGGMRVFGHRPPSVRDRGDLAAKICKHLIRSIICSVINIEIFFKII